MPRLSAILFLALFVSALFAGLAAAAPADDAPRLLLETRCGGCHTGKEAAQGLVLVGPGPGEPAAALSDLKLLERMADRVRSHSMPPPDADEPLAEADRQSLVAWLDDRIDRSVGDARDPGTVAIRRLTRSEYRNTIRDLLGPDLPGVDIDTSTFPSDDVAHGFDNLAEVNSLSPLLMDRYADAASTLGAAWAKAVLARETEPPADAAAARSRAQALLMPLLERGFRRPATAQQREAVMAHLDRLAAAGFDRGEALGGAAARILAAPAFLYRIERDGPIGQDRRPLRATPAGEDAALQGRRRAPRRLA
jgi:hypothetical protein